MNKKTVIVLLLIFSIMLLFNIMTPLLYEDYFATFVWPMGVPNLGELPENVRKVSSFADCIEGIRSYYFIAGGRISGCIIGGIFVLTGKNVFNVFNSLVFVLLVAEIYWISNKGCITIDFEPSKLLWIFFALWTFNGPFIDTYLWMAGSTNYLWMIVVVLAFLLPYVQNYYLPYLYSERNIRMTCIMFVGGVIAGCSHETTTCWLVLLLLYWLYLCKINNTLQGWQISGFLGFCIGYAILIFAPGNFARLGETQYYVTTDARLGDFVFITFFHFTLWYFIFKFFKICKKNNIFGVAYRHFRLAKGFLLVAIGSSLFNFILPVSGWRPSFLSLVFLIITFALLYVAHKEAGLTIIPLNARVLLQRIALLYLVLSIFCSFYSSYNSWAHWNRMIEHIYLERELHPEKIVEVTKPTEKQYEKWALWKCLTMFRVIYQPIGSEDETYRMNRIVARYYNVRGIRVARSGK